MDPGYWDDSDAAQQTEKEIAFEKGWLDAWDTIKTHVDNIDTLLLMESYEGEETAYEIEAMLNNIRVSAIGEVGDAPEKGAAIHLDFASEHTRLYADGWLATEEEDMT